MSGRRVFGVGIPTIMCALTLLTLTAFAALSLVSAGADLRMSRRLAESSAKYAVADAQAERCLAMISDALDAALNEASTEADYQSLFRPSIAGLAGSVSFVSAEGDACVFQVAVDDRHALLVTARFPYGEGPSCVVDGWQLIDTVQWQEYIQGLPVWTGEGMPGF